MRPGRALARERSCCYVGTPRARRGYVQLRVAIGFVFVLRSFAYAQPPLTLEDALREAALSNARLPPARYDVETSRTFVSEARGDLFPTVSLDGDLHYAKPGSHAESLAVFARGPIYDPSIRPRIRVAGANVAGAIATYRMAEADLALRVRTRFSELIEAEAEVEIQREAIDRLARYADTIRARQAAGEGVQADLLQALAQLESQRAALVDVEQRVAESRLQLNDLLGREPTAPLVLAPLPDPTARHIASDAAWLRTPDVLAAAAQVRAASESIDVTRAERRPLVSFELGAGFFGIQSLPPPDATLGHRILQGFGGTATLTYSWTVLDFGSYAARLRRARLEQQKAVANQTVTVRATRLAYEQAGVDLEILSRAIEANARATAAARDAYLSAESVYRGGSGTALAVVDAHRVWVSAAIAEANARLRYRVAEAAYVRWGGR